MNTKRSLHSRACFVFRKVDQGHGRTEIISFGEALFHFFPTSKTSVFSKKTKHVFLYNTKNSIKYGTSGVGSCVLVPLLYVRKLPGMCSEYVCFLKIFS